MSHGRQQGFVHLFLFVWHVNHMVVDEHLPGSYPRNPDNPDVASSNMSAFTRHSCGVEAVLWHILSQKSKHTLLFCWLPCAGCNNPSVPSNFHMSHHS